MCWGSATNEWQSCTSALLCKFCLLQKQEDERMWLIFNTVTDFISMVATAGSIAVTPEAGDKLGSVKDLMDKYKDVVKGVDSLLQPPQELTNLVVLADTSQAAYDQVMVHSCVGRQRVLCHHHCRP